MTQDNSAQSGGQQPRRFADGESAHPSGVVPQRIADESQHRSMASTTGWTILGTIFPGLGFIRAGRKVLGGVILGVFLLLVVGAAAFTAFNSKLVVRLALDADVLLGASIAIVVIGLLWVVCIAATNLSLRPPFPTPAQRAASAVTVGVLSLVVAAPAAIATNVTFTMATAVCKIFGGNGIAEAVLDCKSGGSATLPNLPLDDTWKDKPRLNVLVLGGDNGEGRDPKLSIRPDTVIVASIDTANGDTTLISIPRQTGFMPFPKDSPLYKYFPNGFNGGTVDDSEYMLNAMWQNLPELVPKDILGNPDTLSSDAMKLSVGEATGLTIDYFVLINMDGFKALIDALGGITVNINYPIPMGGKCEPTQGINQPPNYYLKPGPDQHLTGNRALWYARGRYACTSAKWGNLFEHNSNQARMARQTCMINAVVKQITPENLLLKYQSIAEAGEQMIMTDVPSDMLQPLMYLAGKVRGTKLYSYNFEHNKDGFSTSTPNFDVMRELVKKAISATEKANKRVTEEPSTPSVPATDASAPSEASVPESSPAPEPTVSESSASASSSPSSKYNDLDNACAYHPGEGEG
ncbi:MAG: LCP family protein [Propionibacteriaceae bacterium]|jgi:LCP family protein required for cell wall assembly|nr:LCP family protein [Propionibacteriaceae bacterium]